MTLLELKKNTESGNKLNADNIKKLLVVKTRCEKMISNYTSYCNYASSSEVAGYTESLNDSEKTLKIVNEILTF
jgi:uncharacterized protein YjaG (DUF416 family)